METISKVLFWVANSLLIPDVIILLILFVRALLLTGSFYNQFVTKFKNDRRAEKPSPKEGQLALHPLSPRPARTFAE